MPDLADLRYAARLLRREPGYALVAILTIALGIGAATTLFSIAYGVLLKPLPWPDADRLAQVTETRKGQPGRIRGTITNGSYLAWSDQSSTIEALGGYGAISNTMTALVPGSQEPRRLQIGRLTPSMFQVLKVSPLRGRAFMADDARSSTGAYPEPRVAILSYGLWQEWFGGRDDAIGSSVRLDQMQVTVVGVMPRDFAFPDRETRAWLPMPVSAVLGEQGMRRMMIFAALARLKPGYTFEQAAAEATARARTAPDPGLAAVSMFGSAAPPDIAVTSAVAAMTADVKPAITLLLAGVALLFLTAVANIGSLQLARATARRREIAVRAAIGAGRGRLTRQMMVESALIAATGGAAGLLLVLALHRLLPSLLPADFPRVADIEMSPVVLLFALVASFVASIACGTLPAIHVRRVELVEALSDGSGTSTAGGWRSRSGRVRAIVMAGQVAVACVLLVGAVLLTRSFVALLDADRGYDPLNLLTARVDFAMPYDGPRRAAFADAMIARMSAVPGVEAVAVGNALPLVSMGGTLAFSMPSLSNPGMMQQVQTLTRVVSPSYFRTLKLRMLDGQALRDADSPRLPLVVVNRSFAQRYLGPSPVGTRLPIPLGGERRDYYVAGVVEDMRQAGVSEPPAPELFLSYRQVPERLASIPLIVVVRVDGDPMAHVSTLRTTVREQAPSAVLDSVMTMEDRVMTHLARPRLYAVLLGAFGAFALLIAGVGLFGVLSYAVSQRSREIGVRTALGARTQDVIALVLKHAAVVAVTGVAIGLAASLALSRLLTTFLYGVTAHDTVSFVIVAIVLGLVAGAAAVVPARRAARVDPLIVMKSL